MIKINKISLLKILLAVSQFNRRFFVKGDEGDFFLKFTGYLI
jgi:hypothetical protein